MIVRGKIEPRKIERDKIERGKYIGERVNEPTEDNAGDFERCPGCGRWIDCRDLADVFDHAGPLPPHRAASRTAGPILLDRRTRH
jgi:hypothetical protein